MKHFNHQCRKIPLWERLVNERYKIRLVWIIITMILITTKEKHRFELDALQVLFKTLPTSDTNGHFSEYVATRRTSSVSPKTVPLHLDANRTQTSFPGSLFSLGTRLIECLSRDRGLEEICQWPILRNGVYMLQITSNSRISSKRVSVAREFLFCYQFLTKVLLEETSGPWCSLLESISDLAFVALAVSDSILL